ncbi:MAG: PA domain-containing protein [Massilia sp.]
MRNNTTAQLTRTLVAAACAVTCFAASAATIQIQNRDPAGFGFNDPTPVAPVGGNMGTTLGQQRLNVYRYVADIWEKNLDSPVPITVSAGWEALTCTDSSAVLGSAGAWNIWNNTPGAQKDTWYAAALANKLAGVNLAADQPDDGTGYGNVDIKTQFNANLGNPGCLTGTSFYLGFDGKAGANVNFVETLLHELGHGLGFSVISVNTGTGQRINAAGTAYVTNGGLPSVWEQFMFDNTAKKSWLNMTSAERKASAINPLKLAWTGPNVAAGQGMLSATPVLKVTATNASLSGNMDFNTAPFGSAVPTSGSIGKIAALSPQPNTLGPACEPLTAANANAVRGNAALVQRGGCTFAIKVKNLQDAGATFAVLYNNVDGALVPGGSDPAITIPVLALSLADGLKLQTAVTGGSRSAPASATGALTTDPTRIAGADAFGRPLLYTPAVLASGSSVSHWDVTASPNLLMEPNINPDLGTILVAPKDLTKPLLQDIGW